MELCDLPTFWHTLYLGKMAFVCSYAQTLGTSVKMVESFYMTDARIVVGICISKLLPNYSPQLFIEHQDLRFIFRNKLNGWSILLSVWFSIDFNTSVKVEQLSVHMFYTHVFDEITCKFAPVFFLKLQVSNFWTRYTPLGNLVVHTVPQCLCVKFCVSKCVCNRNKLAVISRWEWLNSTVDTDTTVLTHTTSC